MSAMPAAEEFQSYPAAPNFELPDTNGVPVRLSTLWADKPLALAVLPEFGRAACDDNASQLRDNDERIIEAGGAFAAIIHAAPFEAAAFARDWNLDYLLLCDADGTAAVALSLAADESGATLPASFIINTRGEITHEHLAVAPSAFASAWVLVGEIEELTGARIKRPEVSANFNDPLFSRPLLNKTADRTPTTVRSGDWSCSRCRVTQFELNDVSTASGFLSRMFNLQNRRFTGVTCLGCGYTELYKRNSPALMNIVDFLSGG